MTDIAVQPPKKVAVRFLKEHRHDNVDHEEGDLLSVHPDVAKLLTRAPRTAKPGEQPEQQVAELVVDKPAAVAQAK